VVEEKGAQRSVIRTLTLVLGVEVDYASNRFANALDDLSSGLAARVTARRNSNAV
jgi:hypothetical protein